MEYSIECIWIILWNVYEILFEYIEIFFECLGNIPTRTQRWGTGDKKNPVRFLVDAEPGLLSLLKYKKSTYILIQK
jgi:hypothetical protein